jgi:hypothetical protein
MYCRRKDIKEWWKVKVRKMEEKGDNCRRARRM